MKLSERIIKQYITTLIGLIIIIASIVSVFTVDMVSWSDAAIGIGVGIILFFIRDGVTLNKLKRFMPGSSGSVNEYLNKK